MDHNSKGCNRSPAGRYPLFFSDLRFSLVSKGSHHEQTFNWSINGYWRRGMTYGDVFVPNASRM